MRLFTRLFSVLLLSACTSFSAHSLSLEDFALGYADSTNTIQHLSMSLLYQQQLDPEVIQEALSIAPEPEGDMPDGESMEKLFHKLGQPCKKNAQYEKLYKEISAVYSKLNAMDQFNATRIVASVLLNLRLAPEEMSSNNSSTCDTGGGVNSDSLTNSTSSKKQKHQQ